jgi:hypothetical protein
MVSIRCQTFAYMSRGSLAVTHILAIWVRMYSNNLYLQQNELISLAMGTSSRQFNVAATVEQI